MGRYPNYDLERAWEDRVVPLCKTLLSLLGILVLAGLGGALIVWVWAVMLASI